ncbi:uncharacterized protein BT62DRAFT_1013447 [Guyanagaster necrorhizus]|uniref:Uncharacterized protein n=1 Tax=Guyanagaster necrorhizus TaxID=856835 RepID=A0A9P8ALN2_9AGAR|nr:uncharacterized protein BT62DRAFT_1013447 [Guyanagaster necrorhizus MCA 3950]KAG7439821.1 hypothetical protein BT62DRAFT_1013447 [Guyanagaster necrorhizus MCA 3950]
MKYHTFPGNGESVPRFSAPSNRRPHKSLNGRSEQVSELIAAFLEAFTRRTHARFPIAERNEGFFATQPAKEGHDDNRYPRGYTQAGIWQEHKLPLAIRRDHPRSADTPNSRHVRLISGNRSSQSATLHSSPYRYIID